MQIKPAGKKYSMYRDVSSTNRDHTSNFEVREKGVFVNRGILIEDYQD